MFVADRELDEKSRYIPTVKNSYSERVAVIGSGPAGLSCAYYLAEMGYKVTVFEKDAVPGGMLVTGIPAFRLEKDVVNAEIDILRKLGVEFRCGVEVGKDVTVAQLKSEGYSAFYIAIGAQKGTALKIRGEATPGVYSGIDFLKAVNLGKNPDVGGKVVVIGGGNVAVDVARTAVRLGAEVTVVYRRKEADMPAAADEVAEAREEGVQFEFERKPAEILAEDGKVRAIRFENGELECSSVISAIGQAIDYCGLDTQWRLELGRKNSLNVDEVTFETTEEGVFAGGDVVTGPKFAIHAIAAGKQGAVSINRYLRGLNMKNNRSAEYVAISKSGLELGGFDEAPRQKSAAVDPAASVKTFRDLRKGLSEEQIRKETERCLRCGKSVVDTAKCIGCGVCTLQCKFDAIHLERVSESTPAGGFGNWYGRILKYAVKRAGKATFNGIRELGK
jgi:NADPH-dependent glutamate synthase beta subunit-like oxidoreductase